jgi:hypothetical protein
MGETVTSGTNAGTNLSATEGNSDQLIWLYKAESDPA